MTSHQKAKDEKLLADFIQTRDLTILGELFGRYTHLVYGVCLKYLKNREQSQDAVMAIFEHLIEETPRHKINNFKSWLYVVTKNHCLMTLRSAKTANEKFEQYSRDYSMEFEQKMHPIDEAPEQEIEKKLQICIENLKDEQKKCVQLFYYEKKTYKEIAKKIKADERKVKSLIQNGKRNLKICLEKGGVKHAR